MEKAVGNLKRSEPLSHYVFRSYRPHGFDVELGPRLELPVVPSDLVRFEDVELDAQRYSLRRSGRNLKLERIPMELLLFLVRATRPARHPRRDHREALGQGRFSRYRQQHQHRHPKNSAGAERRSGTTSLCADRRG